MDELDNNLLAAWHRVFERCRNDPAEARRRYQRTLPGTLLDRPARAWCVAIRASDSRINEIEGAVGMGVADWGLGVGDEAADQEEEEIQTLDEWINGSAACGRGLATASIENGICEDAGGFDPVRARVAHEVELDAYSLSDLGGPVKIPYPGVPLTEAAKLLGRDSSGMRHWIPVGAGRSRVERDALAARGMSDGRLIWATFEKRGFPLKVRYEPAGKYGQRGREVPVVWSEHALDPGAAKGLPPASWWGALWMSLADRIPDHFEQGLVRVPRFLPCKGRMRFRGWLWRCPGRLEAGKAADGIRGLRDWALEGEAVDRESDLRPPMPSAAMGCGRLVPKLYAPLPVWTVGRYYGIKEGLDVEGLSGQWFPGVMDRWAGRRSLACRQCWRVRNGGAAERHGWNEFVTHLSGGLLFGSEVQKPSDFEYERRRPRKARKGKRGERRDDAGEDVARVRPRVSAGVLGSG